MSWKKVYVTDRAFLDFKEFKRSIEVFQTSDKDTVIYPNDGVEISSSIGGPLNGIYDSEVGIRPLNAYNPQFKIPKNRDLMKYNDLLNNPKVNTIIVNGFYGTAKTSTAMAHVVNYMKTAAKSTVYLSKPHVSLGKSYGALPGNLREKTKHEFRSFYQYMDRFWEPGIADALLAKYDGPAESLYQKEYGGIDFDILPFEYLRGLDIPEAWVVLDEGQNTSVKEMADFITRATDAAKVIVLGDLSTAQMDRQDVIDPRKNGFAFIKDVFKGTPYSGYVEMNTRNHILRGERVKHLHDAIARLSK